MWENILYICSINVHRKVIGFDVMMHGFHMLVTLFMLYLLVTCIMTEVEDQSITVAVREMSSLTRAELSVNLVLPLCSFSPRVNVSGVRDVRDSKPHVGLSLYQYVVCSQSWLLPIQCHCRFSPWFEASGSTRSMTDTSTLSLQPAPNRNVEHKVGRTNSKTKPSPASGDGSEFIFI